MIAPDEIEPRLAALRDRLDGMRGYLDLETHRRELAALEEAAAAPGFWDDPKAAQETIAATNAHKAVLRPYDDLVARLSDAETMLELAREEPEGAPRDAALAEVGALAEEAEGAFASLRTRSLLTGPLDRCNAFLTLHAGAGGTEACDWVSMLLRMYSRFCERSGWQLEMMDETPGDEAGLVTCTFAVRGPDAYGYLKAERGVHRLVRISPFDANARRHTSFASLDVVAELEDETTVELRPEDLEVDTYRSGGAGGQHVNKTDSAIRITHLPTGVVVQCQNERSQHKNKDKAMQILKARLYLLKEQEKQEKLSDIRGEVSDNGWGSQIRSYVMQPYTMVKDHRTNEEIGNAQSVLDGNLDPFMNAYLRYISNKDQGE